MPLLALGAHIFEIDGLSFQEIEQETSVKWPAISRFGRRPTRQMTGYGEDTLYISGLLYPEAIGGRPELAALRETQQLARPVIMIGWSADLMNAARIFGSVVILTIRDRHSRFGPDGSSRKISYDIELAPAGDTAGAMRGWW